MPNQTAYCHRHGAEPSYDCPDCADAHGFELVVAEAAPETFACVIEDCGHAPFKRFADLVKHAESVHQATAERLEDGKIIYRHKVG